MDARLSWLLTAGIAGFLVWLAFWGSSAADPQAGGRPAVEKMLNRTMTENDPAQCTEDMTPRLVEQNFGGHPGTTAMERCIEQNNPEGDVMADSVTIKSVAISGSTARAVVLTHGGSMDGSQITVDLVAQGGRWKIDHFADLQIDRSNVDQEYIRRMHAAGLTLSESRCVVRTLDRKFSDAELEHATLSGVDNLKTEGVGLGCLGRPTLVQMFEKSVASEVQSRGVPAPVADCIASRFTHAMSLGELRGVVKADHLSESQGLRVRAIAQECAIAYRGGALPQSGST